MRQPPVGDGPATGMPVMMRYPPILTVDAKTPAL